MTVDVRQVEHARIKAFYKLLVDRLGANVWARRRAAFVERIRAKESNIDLNMAIEPQLFVTPEEDIDWYILVAELAYDSPYSDCAYLRGIPPFCGYSQALNDAMLLAPTSDLIHDCCRQTVSPSAWFS